MFNALSLRKAFKTVMILMTCFLMTGCYTLRTATLNTIPKNAEVMIVHADTNYWKVVDFSFTDNFLTATLSPDTVKVKKANIVHVYAAPVSAVTLEGTVLTVPVRNIAKTDYQELNAGETLGFGVILVSLIFTFLILLG